MVLFEKVERRATYGVIDDWSRWRGATRFQQHMCIDGRVQGGGVVRRDIIIGILGMSIGSLL
jgi:hypothetical protein